MTAPSSPMPLEIIDLRVPRRNALGRKNGERLKGVSLALSHGECFAFLGHNGAGKTTTIKCILDLIRPEQGSVRLFGRSSRDHQARQGVGYIAEHPYFSPALTVQETLSFFAKLSSFDGQETARDAIQRVSDRLRLHPHLHHRLRTLSKGTVQRVALAQALLNRPRFLVLDEPFSGLDPGGRREFRQIFLDEKSCGTTIFISTHVLSDAEAMCDRAAFLIQGELRAIVDLKNKPRAEDISYELAVPAGASIPSNLTSAGNAQRSGSEIILTFDSARTGEEALNHCLHAGVPILSYSPIQPSLESFFVSLMEEEKR
jgi:ABC-2 type transport system ATP-binding protein